MAVGNPSSSRSGQDQTSNGNAFEMRPMPPSGSRNSPPPPYRPTSTRRLNTPAAPPADSSPAGTPDLEPGPDSTLESHEGDARKHKRRMTLLVVLLVVTVLFIIFFATFTVLNPKTVSRMSTRELIRLIVAVMAAEMVVLAVGGTLLHCLRSR